MYHPNLNEYKKLVKLGNLIPVYREILADTDTPVSAYMKMLQSPILASSNDLWVSSHDSFLLESLSNNETWARYSFIGLSPKKIIKSWDALVEISQAGHEPIIKHFDDPITALKQELSLYTPVAIEGLPPFYGGLVGYIGYENVKYFERCPDSNKSGVPIPDMCFLLTDSLLIFDHQRLTIKIVVNTITAEDVNPEDAYNDAIKKINQIEHCLRHKNIDYKTCTPISNNNGDIAYSSSFASKQDFMDAVEKSKEYIKAGDIFQVVLSQRFNTQSNIDPFNIYRALRIINPSPYMFYLNLNDVKIVGASPEILVRKRKDKVILRPIAGTRKRGRNEDEDISLEKELLTDPKELAEHIMLVDLGRNDLGRVARVGSIKINKLKFIERYSHVMHIVSDIEGTLEQGLDAFDVLRACFPAGTVTGAPKVRAMEIINELEPVKRGPYAGAVGYFSFSGDMDTCITIRTLFVKDDQIYFQAGAGIVADSIAENEFEETLNKARAVMRAIKMAKEELS
ncbi:MAG: anthranilate synthase component I [Nitrospirae bacterium]|nr:anthranilate synthase component I [Nitrospirota bacterium]